MMFKYLPKNMIVERNLMQNPETPGAVLRRLPHLMKAFQFSKEANSYHSQLELIVEARNNTLKDHEKATVQWMIDCFNKLKTSKFAKNSLVKPAMKKVEDLLIHRLYEPKEGVNFKGYIENCLEVLCGAVDAIANFGNDPIFDGWAKINSSLFCPTHDVPSPQKTVGELSDRWKLVPSFGPGKLAIAVFPKETKGEVPLTKLERQELRKIFNREFDCWVVHPPKLEIDSQGNRHEFGQIVHLRYGFFGGFIFPSYVQNLRHRLSKQGQREWLELRDSDPSTLYEYLKLLKLYEGYEYATIPPKQNLETWDDVERYIVQGNTGLFLSSFSSEDESKHPHTLQQLRGIIDQFLAMVEANEAQKDLIKGGARKSKMSKAAEEWSIRELVSYINDMLQEKRSLFTYTRAFTYLKQKATISSMDFCGAITKTLVKEKAAPQARKKLELIGIIWIPSGGRPKKDAET